MSEESPRKHQRRPRYKGKNPRRFDEKYKEHQPGKYGPELDKIISSGKTPAGTHRPIMVNEVLEVLQPKPGLIGVDATLGYGGHAEALLGKLMPDGHLLALDADPIEFPKTEVRLREAGFGTDVLSLVRSNYAGLPQAINKAGFSAANFILADLGLSSMQIDNPERGFTFKWEGPFDLRLNPNRGLPASQFVANMKVSKLAEVLRSNADEPYADQIAPALIDAAKSNELSTTLAAATIIRSTITLKSNNEEKPKIDATIRRVFQAVRIAVNDEFGALETFLRNLPGCLQPDGRVAILTFHSGEDRRVKKAFRQGLEAGIYSNIADEITRPSPQELRSNPRASPAKLRWAIRSQNATSTLKA